MVRINRESAESTLQDGKVNRRALLGALSAVAAGSLAGCLGDDDSADDDDSGDGPEGERVPTIDIDYWGALGQTTQSLADMMPYVDNALDAIGASSDIQPVEAFTLWAEIGQDPRDLHIMGGGNNNSPSFLEPTATGARYHIENAGSTPGLSYTHIADCEITNALEDIGQSSTDEEVRSTTHEYFSLYSDNVTTIELCERAVFGAYRTDQVEVPSTGEIGILPINSEAMLTASATGDEPIRLNVVSEMVQTANPTQMAGSQRLWQNLFYSPLLRFDEDWNLMNVLAEDWAVEDDGHTITFELRDGATFHDGEPITAEDVQWTFEFLADNPTLTTVDRVPPYESIDVIDDQTVEFNFTQPYLPFIRDDATTYPILPSHVWIDAGAEENPEEVELPMDPYVASGPYRLTNFVRGEFVRGEPNEDHWRTPDSPIEFDHFQDPQSANRAFVDGDINFFPSISPVQADDLETEDDVEVVQTAGWATYKLFPKHNFGPTKFREFRLAISQAIDRRGLVEAAQFGQSRPILYGAPFTESYPLYPDDHEGLTRIADSEDGDEDLARQILEEEGWEWDDNGDLHYPPGADLAPLWPEGESPRDYPDEFPCIDELGIDPV